MTDSDSTPRRRKVEPGIYTRATADGERLEVMYRDREGRQRLSSTAADGTPLRTLAEARARREELRTDARRKLVTVRTRMRLAEYAQQYLADTERRKRPSATLRERGDVEYHIIPRLGRTYLADLDADTVARFVADLQREGKAIRKGGKVVGHTGLSAHSIRNVLGVLSRIMDRAARAKLVHENPVRLLSVAERPQPDALPFPVLDSDDLAAFMQAVRENRRGARDRATVKRDTTLVWVTLTTGLRLAEVTGLRWRHVDMERGELHVRETNGRYGTTALKTKNGRRTVALEPEALRMLAQLSLDSEHREPDDLVFVTASGKALGHRNVLRIIERARASSGLDAKCDEQGARRLSFHGLRTLYVSLRLDAGDSLTDVSRAVGHGDVTTTDRIYGQVVNARDRVERDRASVARTFGGIMRATEEEVAA